MTELAEVFDDLYRRGGWRSGDSLSGPGSDAAPTARLAAAIAFLVELLEVQSVADAACGDGRWFPDLPAGVDYTGTDVSPEAIALAKANRPDRVFLVNDLRHFCPDGDLVVIRDAMQHLPLADGDAILERVRRAHATWLLASTYLGGTNVDVVAGGAYSPNLELPPFELEPPILLIPDGFAYDDAGAIRDGRKMLGLWRLA